jgi:hypothetical protein
VGIVPERSGNFYGTFLFSIVSPNEIRHGILFQCIAFKRDDVACGREFLDQDQQRKLGGDQRAALDDQPGEETLAEAIPLKVWNNKRE